MFHSTNWGERCGAQDKVDQLADLAAQGSAHLDA